MEAHCGISVIRVNVFALADAGEPGCPNSPFLGS